MAKNYAEIYANPTDSSALEQAFYLKLETTPGVYAYNLVSVSDGNGCSQTQTGTATITVVGHPVISPVGPSTFCDGGNVVLTGSAANSTGNTYRWLREDPIPSTPVVIGGATSSQYTVFTSGNYYVEITNAVCGTLTSLTPYTATVNPIAVVNPISNQTLCNGAATTAVNITSPTPIASGATLTFAWTGGGAIGLADGTGATIPSFNAINAGVTQTVTTITVTPTYTNNSVSCVGTPRTFTITVNPTITASVSIVANANPICSGSSVTFTATPTNGGTAPTYQWYKNSISIFGATSSTYNATFTAADAIYVIMTSNHAGPCLAGSPAQSNTITLSITPDNTASAGTTTTVCINTAISPVIIHTTTGATGIGVATGLPAGASASFSANTISIFGTPTASGTFNYTIPLTGGCGTVNATGTIVVNPASVGGTVAGSATVCTGTNSTTLTLSGNTGVVTGWESSLDNFATAGTPIANTTNTLVATNLTATTYYRAIVSNGVCASVNSSTATVTVSPTSVGGTVAGSTSVCTGTNSTTLTLSGQTGAISGWEYSLDNFTSATPIANITNTLVATNLTATTYYRAVITSGACASANSSVATVTVVQLPTITPSGSTSFCFGGNVVLTASAGTAYQWNLNGTPIIGAYQQTYTVYTAGSYTVTVTNPTCGTNTSAATVVSVNLYVTPSVSIAASANPVCAGTSVTFTATASNTSGGTVNYDFKVDGSSVQSSASNVYTTSSLTNGQVVTCDITVTPAPSSCLITPTATSNSITMTVNAKPTSVVSGGATICAGSTTPISVALTGAQPWTITYTNGVTPTTVSGIAASPYVFNASIAGTYTVTAVSDANCTGTSMTGSAVAVVNPLPTATISGTTAVCAGSPAPNVTFIGANATSPYTFTYNVNGGANTTVTTVAGNSVTVSQPTTIAGTFTYNLVSVQESSSTTCSQAQSGSAVVTVNALPTITHAATAMSVCYKTIAQTSTLAYTGTTNAPTTYSTTWNGSPANSFVAVTDAALVSSPIMISVPSNAISCWSIRCTSISQSTSLSNCFVTN